jgi:hypothetical protein
MFNDRRADPVSQTANSCNFEGWNKANAWPNTDTLEIMECDSNFID